MAVKLDSGLTLDRGLQRLDLGRIMASQRGVAATRDDKNDPVSIEASVRLRAISRLS